MKCYESQPAFLLFLYLLYFFMLIHFYFIAIYFKFRVQIIISYRINHRVAVTFTIYHFKFLLNARVAVIDPEQG